MYVYPYREEDRVDVLPVSVANAKEYLYIGASVTIHDDLIARLLKAVRNFFENATNHYTTEITFKTYRDSFLDGCYEIRKSPLKSIVSIQYYDSDDNIQTINSTNYFIKPMNGYDRVVFKQDYVFPELSIDVGWPIEITFKAGYTDQPNEIPEDIETAILSHLAMIFENRGDCEVINSSLIKKFVPVTTKLAIKNYKIEEIGV